MEYIFTFYIKPKNINYEKTKDYQNKKIFLKNFCKENNYKLSIGPTEYEHKFLMLNNKYYKLSYNNEIYSFCSDAWRIWKLSTLKNDDKAIYIDFFLKWYDTKKITKFFKFLFKENKNFYIFENFNYFWSGFLFQSNNNKELINKINNFMFSNINENFFQYYSILPRLITDVYIDIYDKTPIYFDLKKYKKISGLSIKTDSNNINIFSNIKLINTDLFEFGSTASWFYKKQMLEIKGKLIKKSTYIPKVDFNVKDYWNNLFKEFRYPNIIKNYIKYIFIKIGTR